MSRSLYANEADHANLRARYCLARPWPHLVIDDILEAVTLDAARREAAAIPNGHLDWERTRRVQKGGLSRTSLMGPTLQALFAHLASTVFVEELRALTGIGDLAADPTLRYAGLYVTPPGGWHRVHQDFLRHPVTHRWNRVVAILYLSPWQPGDDGELELWADARDRSPVTVEPRPGRIVIFEPNSHALHGVRRVAAGAPDRLAVSARFYSETPPQWPSMPLRHKLIRRPDESLLSVLPTAREIAKTVRARIVAHARPDV